jgi:5-(carboxyamino)imidazole ribonucleotide synthase
VKIGVLGGGQLGRMLGLAGIPLGHEFIFFDDSPTCPASAVGDVDSLSSPTRLAECDVFTYEFENVGEAARRIPSIASLFPSLRSLDISSDRLLEKDFFVEIGIPTPKYRPFVGGQELSKAVSEIGYPCIAKSRRLGYDGKGQFSLSSVDDFAAAAAACGEAPMILESRVDFDREISIIAARTQQGECRFYPLVENHHKDGILRFSVSPVSDESGAVRERAEGYARLALEKLDYVGILAIEFFQVGDELVANEMAPRVHNSGHWTIEGAECSQFENHIRAITDMPLGATVGRGHSAMFNLIGSVPNIEQLLSVPGTHLHLYGKEPRPGRKLGHVTLRCDDNATFGKGVALLSAIVG